MLDLDEIEAQIAGAYDLYHLNVRVVRDLIAEIREMRAHPLRRLAFDDAAITVDTDRIREERACDEPGCARTDLHLHGACFMCGWEHHVRVHRATLVSDPQSRNGV